VDFVNEKNIALLQICEHRGEITGAFENRARREVELRLHFGRDDVGESGFAETRGAKKQRVVQRFAAIARSTDKDREV
jgi:hypothetical protein